MRAPWNAHTMSRNRKQSGAGNPLNVDSIPWSHQKPATFMVIPATQPSSIVRRDVCPCIATSSGTHATKASGHTSIPGNASQ